MADNSRIAEYIKIDKELIIVLLLVFIMGLIFFFVSNQPAFLNFFYIPVLLGAYFFGKRYATQSALLSIILVCGVAYVYPHTFTCSANSEFSRWLDIVTWGGFLIVTGYCMGLLYEKKERAYREIRSTYWGIVEMLSLLIDSMDKYTQSHSYRVSVFAETIAREMNCSEQEIENIKTAGLLHDLGKLGLSSEVLNKMGSLTVDEQRHITNHTKLGAEMVEPLGGKVLQILPYILYHHEKYDGSGHYKMAGKNIPLGARIIAVADVYDALISDRPYRKGLSPLDARKDIIGYAGTHFDPQVVEAFDSVFHKLDSEMPLLPAHENF